MESALSGFAQHRPCPNKHQQFPWKWISGAQDQQTLFNYHVVTHCTVISLLLVPLHPTHSSYSVLWTGLSPSCKQQQTSLHFPLPHGMCTVFPVPTNSTLRVAWWHLPAETGHVVQWYIANSIRSCNLSLRCLNPVSTDVGYAQKPRNRHQFELKSLLKLER